MIAIQNSSLSQIISIISRDLNYVVSKQLREFGLGKHDVWVLKTINANPGITQNEICERIGEDKITVSKSVKNLVNQSYVRSEKNEEDKRVTSLYITDYGSEIRDDILSIIQGANEMLTSKLSDEESEILMGLLVKASESMRFHVNAFREENNR